MTIYNDLVNRTTTTATAKVNCIAYATAGIKDHLSRYLQCEPGYITGVNLTETSCDSDSIQFRCSVSLYLNTDSIDTSFFNLLPFKVICKKRNQEFVTIIQYQSVGDYQLTEASDLSRLFAELVEDSANSCLLK